MIDLLLLIQSPLTLILYLERTIHYINIVKHIWNIYLHNSWHPSNCNHISIISFSKNRKQIFLSRFLETIFLIYLCISIEKIKFLIKCIIRFKDSIKLSSLNKNKKSISCYIFNKILNTKRLHNLNILIA